MTFVSPTAITPPLWPLCVTKWQEVIANFSFLSLPCAFAQPASDLGLPVAANLVFTHTWVKPLPWIGQLANADTSYGAADSQPLLTVSLYDSSGATMGLTLSSSACKRVSNFGQWTFTIGRAQK